MPRELFLKRLDPDNTLSVDEVRDAVIEAHKPFMKMTRPKKKEHQSMTLSQLLDTAEQFHLIEDKGSKWSVVRWACSCTRCYQWACCGYDALIDMLMNAERVVPADLEHARPSLRRLCTGSKGMAGTKRKQFLARIEQEKKTGVKKSKKFNIIRPNVSVVHSKRIR